MLDFNGRESYEWFQNWKSNGVGTRTANDERGSKGTNRSSSGSAMGESEGRSKQEIGPLFPIYWSLCNGAASSKERMTRWATG